MRRMPTMRAMVIPSLGPPNIFELREIERPKPGPGEVLVRVIASGTNPVDAKIRQAGAWAQLKMPAVLGYDVSGVIEELGPGVTQFKVGDEVFYTPEIFGNSLGSYAEYNAVSTSIIARKPATLSHAEAAAIPLAGGTAWEAVIRRLAIRAGETLLIHGGAGGVGSFAVQFGKAAGTRVIATASAEHQETLRKLGADVALDYKAQNVVDEVMKATGGAGVDATFDTVGKNVGASTQCTRAFGRIATIIPPGGDLSSLSGKNLTLHGVFLTREAARLKEMAPLFDRGQAKPVIDQVIALDQVSKAHERLDSGHGRGKIILEVAKR